MDGGSMKVVDQAAGSDHVLYQGDCVEIIRGLPDNSIDLSVFSPPFQSLYVYSPSERDMANASNPDEFFEHFGFLIEDLLRVTKPGRNCCVHVTQLTATKVNHGYIGLIDFRGRVVKEFTDRDWIYHGEVCIDKCPQAQAIRTHSKGLLFVQLKKDSSWLRPGLADYILVFRKEGDNAVPIKPDISNDDWIEWARPIWYGIKETDTLNVVEARDNRDERHICPLQLGTIERCIRLWSNPGETVLSPFAGIGSEGYVALKQRRRFIGIEIKAKYFNVARKNLEVAVASRNTIFDAIEATQ
jgi:DNA modification methylase